jgi:D-alanyl-D-alanine carboxypeptidase
VTKTYTATVVLQLVGERKLQLDDTVEHWLPGAITNGSAITVRQLLNHTSGIFDYVQDPRVLGPYFENYPSSLTLPFDPRVGVRVAAEHGPLYAPGTGWNYSNTNSLLLAMIVEAATGRSFGSELEARIFRPLKLRHTSYPTTSTIRGRHVHGYFQFEDSLLDFTALNPTLLGASGGIVSNASDVTKFYRALLRGRLIDTNLLAAMRKIDPVATDPPTAIPDAGFIGGGWGLGLLRETFPCGYGWGHDTENLGYMTAAWTNQDATRQVVVIVNPTSPTTTPSPLPCATPAERHTAATSERRRPRAGEHRTNTEASTTSMVLARGRLVPGHAGQPAQLAHHIRRCDDAYAHRRSGLPGLRIRQARPRVADGENNLDRRDGPG